MGSRPTPFWKGEYAFGFRVLSKCDLSGRDSLSRAGEKVQKSTKFINTAAGGRGCRECSRGGGVNSRIVGGGYNTN